MLPRHRRRIYLSAPEYRSAPSLLPRIMMLGVLLIVLWYVASFIMSFFDASIGKRSGVLLSVTTGTPEVSLQGDDWQRATGDIRLYSGDQVASRSATDGILRFFDATGIRMDSSTEIEIIESEERVGASSTITVSLTRGELWVRTPTLDIFTGAILRTVRTDVADITIPSGASARISPELVHVLSADGQGLEVTITSGAARGASVIIGEGQYLALTEEHRALLESGRDPYTLRDPATTELLRHPFVTSSLTLLNTIPVASNSDAESANTDALVLSSPANNQSVATKTVTVAGQVSSQVALLLIQGQQVSTEEDGSFSVDVSVTEGESFVIRAEAQNAQGIPLSTIERTVRSTWTAFVEPVRITAPVGSGGTFVTGRREVEIAGEAPANTAHIRVNDYTLQLFTAGSRTWSYVASQALGNLKPGPNTFTVYALDAEGNVSAGRSIIIQVEEGAAASSAPPLKQNAPIDPGSLSIYAPERGTEATVTAHDILIEGNTSPVTASISVNGYTLALYEAGKTTWNYIASTELQTLKRGRNVYRVVSRNAQGEILDIVEYVITFNP